MGDGASDGRWKVGRDNEDDKAGETQYSVSVKASKRALLTVGEASEKIDTRLFFTLASVRMPLELGEDAKSGWSGDEGNMVIAGNGMGCLMLILETNKLYLIDCVGGHDAAVKHQDMIA